VLALAAIAAGMAIFFEEASFFHHSSSAGSALIGAETRSIALSRAVGECASTSTGAGSSSLSPSGSSLAGGVNPQSSNRAAPVWGLLSAPSIGLVAPVVEGTEPGVLDVGVGHVPASSLPGPLGTVVLAAHNVTWFSGIDRLAAGATISITTPCQKFTYSVVGHRVVATGSPIYQSTTARLFLVTCYPLDSLFSTPQRYLVQASLSNTENFGSALVEAPSFRPLPKVALPPLLAAQSLDEPQVGDLGSLSLQGVVDAAFKQSEQPLRAERLVVRLYAGALATAQEGRPDWWQSIAPGVAFSTLQRLSGSVSGYASPVDVTLYVSRSVVIGARIQATPIFERNGRRSKEKITMVDVVQDGNLVIDGVGATSPS
jgi:LPXTG-site transpeptidase (sortase) family protein